MTKHHSNSIELHILILQVVGSGRNLTHASTAMSVGLVTQLYVRHAGYWGPFVCILRQLAYPEHGPRNPTRGSEPRSRGAVGDFHWNA